MGDRVRAKVVRASGFMSKPVNADKLLATIEKFVPREQAAAS
jgi:DNA-binding response OmpR family regulator